MFDDVKKDPEDMFEATDKVAPQVTPPTDISIPVAENQIRSVDERMAQTSQKQGGFPWKVIFLFFGIFVVIGAIFFLSMKLISSRTPVTPEPPGELEKVEQIEQVEEVEEPEEPIISNKDTDKDGLTDAEESEFGTSVRTQDTDADGLFDLEEIRTWKTDPLNPDTDGDGYLDGEEIDAGYNPSGEGVLREPPTESS